MKIATYNINGVKGRIGTLLKWLKEAKPDIVCLQELKCEDKSFPIAQINEAGYQAVWVGQKAWNGVAVLSKKPIKELRRDLPGEDEEYIHSRYLEVFTYDIVVGCIYLPYGNPFPGPKFEYKKRWFSRLVQHAATLIATGLPVMLVGDYNVMPTDLDTYKPEKYKNDALFQPEIKADYQAMLDKGWTDAIRTLYPNEAIYTYWDYLRKAYDRNAGLRLDHFLLTADLAEKLKDGNVDKHVRGWEGASDHAPVWIELASTALKKNLKKAKVQSNSKSSIFSRLPEEIQQIFESAEEQEMPTAIKPMKATLVDQPFDEPGWIYEIKWDGYRAISYLSGREIKIVSRNNLEFTQFETIKDALSGLNLDAIFDGEIVALKDDSSADFGALQNWKNTKNAKLHYYIFDILWVQGYSLMDKTLTERRQILEQVLPKDHPLIKISQAFLTSGIDFFDAAKGMA
ncbi:MAG: exodeoxyribonuclease III [Chryseobacterium sp.]|nr:MAG: exodeoxyribonuclease III [Chryseobacterium sp.]